MLINLRDVLSSYNNGKFAEVANLMQRYNPMVTDAPVKEANSFYKHSEVQLVQLPDAFDRRFNEGVDTSKSVRTQVGYPIGITETHMEMDALLWKGIKDKEAFVRGETEAFIESLMQKVGHKILYSNEAVNEQIGLTQIYNDRKADFIGEQIISADGTQADGLTSIWMISWNINGIFLVYPEGATAGYAMETFANDTITDDNGKEFKGIKILYQMRLAPVVKNPMYAVRIANIPTNEALEDISIVKLLEQAWIRMRKTKVVGKQAFYCNSIIYNRLMQEIDEKTRYVSGSRLMSPNTEEPVFEWWGVPIKSDDQIMVTEDEVA
jgi:hypothetical protein